MVAYLKQSEKDPSILTKEFVYQPDLKAGLEKIPFDDPSNLVVGGTYSVDELIKKMIIDSDNGAKNLLLSNLDTKYLLQIYSELNLKTPDLENSYQISPKAYSLFIRILYNATYLSAANSEKALSILSKATFKDGLVAGVPAGTVVAHKYGEYADTTNYNINFVELHDCGIVYTPQNPYLLCVMTRGKDIKNLQNEIGAISKIVYDTIVAKK
jgi:beta-lactamase class A